MTPEIYARLDASFQTLVPRGPELVQRFYNLLFSQYPEVRPLFPEDMSEQKNILLAALALAIQNLRNPDALNPMLHDLGARHVRYGTQPEHYPLVCATMLEVIGEMLGDQWNAQLKEDWAQALNLIAEKMLEGANQSASAH